MKLLATGVIGFICSRICRQLLKRGDSVIELDNINDYYNHELKYGCLATLGTDRTVT